MGDNIENHAFIYGYLAGHCIVFGKELNSDKTYHGKVIFAYEKDRLIVTREIEGKILKGE
jgi:hypothetical protein